MAVKFRKGFLDSQEGKDIRRIFQLMAHSDSYNTASSYSTDTAQYPDNLIPFADRHMNYLNAHPKLEPAHYIANIKLMSRVR
jgi:hypothetical protein